MASNTAAWEKRLKRQRMEHLTEKHKRLEKGDINQIYFFVC